MINNYLEMGGLSPTLSAGEGVQILLFIIRYKTNTLVY